MPYNAFQKGSPSQKRDREPGEVNAGLLMIVSAVLLGTCLTVAAFVTTTPSVDEEPLQECDDGAAMGLPQAPIAPDGAGCSCAGTTAKPGSTQPS